MRHVLLEELYEQPVLNSQKMSANTASFLKYYKTPPTLNQVETALANEFNPLSIPLDSSGDGFVARKTDWSKYSDPVEEGEQEQAALLIASTVSSICKPIASKTIPTSDRHPAEQVPIGRNPEAGKLNEFWVQKESDLLQNEIDTGCHKRWDPEALLPFNPRTKPDENWSAERRNHLLPPAQILAKNSLLHPRIKQQVMSTLIGIIKKTIN